MVYMLAFESKDRTEPQPNSNATSKKIILCINIKIMAINLGNKSQEHTNLKFSRRLSLARVYLTKIKILSKNADNLKVPGGFTLPVFFKLTEHERIN